ncbi:MAG TPA: hypothetical protein VNW71_11405 [Thermoanaerobaculia bacterium]|nr:hypothetical protein [Thermoanaerobaculia bacterium]
MKNKVFATLRVVFLLGSVLVAGLSFLPSESEASYCKPGCGPQGPIWCGGSGCRQPE